MRPPPRAPRHRIDRGEGDAGRRLVRDAYLDEFRCFESRSSLREAFALSARLAPLYDVMRFDATGDTEAAFRRGLTRQDAHNARAVMDELLDVCRGRD